jgi:succinyl-diaminopimelate desuccinylase
METNVERLLATLVGMPTISSDISANDMALDYIEDFLKRCGMHSGRKRFAGHGALLASTRADNLLMPTVLLAAHIDVVGGEAELFALRREGDTLLGRGVFDMKFAIAGYLQVVEDLKDNLQDYDFGILITSDEETIDVGVKSALQDGLKPGVCLLPDSAAAGWEIETTAKGYLRVDLIAHGTTAHGGRPWEGESASMKLIQALHELKSHFEGQSAASDSLNIGKIHGGDAYNVVPSEMIAGVDIRFLSKENFAQKKQLIEDICKKHDLSWRQLVYGEPVITDKNQPLVRTYLDSVQAVTGRRPQDFISSAGSDAPYFQEAGVPCIVSCCEGGKHHTKDEWIGRKSFLQFVPIVHAFLNNAARSPLHATSPYAKKMPLREPVKSVDSNTVLR